ncbi:MAG TPA: PD-(D/E)XK nuclease family protein [Pirellulaceae bacterium]|nr:PD-(D/E)XK nuclease family protein [Pirellulaceae bacterium]
MPITRKFLGSQQPALAAAADYLLQRYTRQQNVDMSQVVVVVPVGRAGRRLLELLVERCETNQLVLQPPTIETVGVVPEQLYIVQRPLASELTQQLAWAKAVAETDPAFLVNLVPQPPLASQADRWLELGDLLRTQHRELASDRLDFSNVAKRAAALPGFDEEPRWQTLADIQTRYLSLLDRLDLWDIQTARLVAIEKRECRTDRDFILVAVADMNRTLRAMLDQVASHVTAVIAADESWATRFDSHGCLIPEAWQQAEIPLRDEQVLRVDGPADQAYAVAELLGKLNGRYRADEITIGVPNEALAPQITRQLSEFNLTTRFVNEQTVGTTGPFLLLKAAANYLNSGSFADFAALVRHPDYHDWLMQQHVHVGLLKYLDELQGERLPGEFTVEHAWLKEKWPAVAKALTITRRWLAPLSDRELPLSQWKPLLEELLVKAYQQRSYARHGTADRITLAACESLQQALASLNDVPAVLSPKQNAVATIELILSMVAGEQIPPPAESHTLEMLGWLELPLDDAPALIVTTFNEGFVPSSRSADMFLPNRLRQHLGLNDSQRSYARDAYALCLLLATREHLTLIVGRHDHDRNPLAPSRLLFASNQATIAQRALRFFRELPPARPKLLLGGSILPRSESHLEVPLPEPLPAPLEYLRVTDFRSYLACPYRFYLKRVLGLKSLDDAAEELDGGRFGDLLHTVLQAFGSNDEIRTTTNPQHLADWLAGELQHHVDQQWGAHRRPTVNLQIEQLRMRLNRFAHWQTERTSAGWQIWKVEEAVKKELAFGSELMVVQGRIDRIDYHPDQREWMVLDYKSGDAGDPPKKTHRRGGDWIDLQLPLYRRLAQLIEGIDGPPQVGYILLPKDLSAVGDQIAEWGDDEWKSDDAVAEQVVADIRHERFWPPNYEHASLDEDLAAICQENVAGRRLPQTTEEATS